MTTMRVGVLPRLQNVRLPAMTQAARGFSMCSLDSQSRATASISRAKPENSSGLPTYAESHSGISPRWLSRQKPTA